MEGGGKMKPFGDILNPGGQNRFFFLYINAVRTAGYPFGRLK